MFDVELFITEVQQRSTLWDVSSPIYSNHAEKEKAWNELTMIFEEKFDELDNKKKKAAVDGLKRKWKNIRDCFRKEYNLQMEAKSGSAAKMHRPYAYYQQLSFLIPNMTSKPTQSSMDSEEHSENSSVEEIDSAPPPPKRRAAGTAKERKSADSDLRLKLYEKLHQRLEDKKSENSMSDNQMFLLSMTKDLDRVPQHLKYQFRAEMMQNFAYLMAKYTQTYSESTYTSVSSPPIASSPMATPLTSPTIMFTQPEFSNYPNQGH